MDVEKNLPSTNVEEEMIEILQLSLMLLLRQNVGQTVVIPKNHLNVMKNFTVDVKINDQVVQYTLVPLPQRGSSNSNEAVNQPVNPTHNSVTEMETS